MRRGKKSICKGPSDKGAWSEMTLLRIVIALYLLV